ncbi:hypothetical protein WDJ50_17895 (plasmid) [Deinococcus sp. VB142]|uniref:Uncharacterized protein n=2 Tax=unclassified Deinococcus TaxID=2623546 RepID=A0AAU6Q8V3_9DEIO
MDKQLKLIVAGKPVTLRLTENDRGLRRVWIGGFPGCKLTLTATYYDRGGMDATRYALEVSRYFEPSGTGGFDLGATLEQASAFFGLDMVVQGWAEADEEEEMPF